MKVSPGNAESFCARPDPKARVILVYGPDEGLARERITRLMKTVVDDLDDPFRVADIAAAQLKSDPALLADEAAAQALTGGRRVVRLRDADDGTAKAIDAFLKDPVGDALVVVRGGDLGPRSALRKLLEGAANGAAVPCYLDDNTAIDTLVRESLAAHNFSISRDAMDYVMANLGGDRQVTRQEVDKLLTYMGAGLEGAGGEVTLDDVMACIGDVSALSLDDLCYAIADGDAATAQALLDRLTQEGHAVVRLLRVVSGHFQRLHLAGGAMAAGKSADQAMALIRPPVFFKLKSRFTAQLRRWPPRKAGQALEYLLQAEIDCKTTGMPEYEVGARVFLQLARAAGVGRR